MLFYASEKYPGEHEYTKYITEVHSIDQLQVANCNLISLHNKVFYACISNTWCDNWHNDTTIGRITGICYREVVACDIYDMYPCHDWRKSSLL